MPPKGNGKAMKVMKKPAMKLTKALKKKGSDWAMGIRHRRNPPFTLCLQFASGAIAELPGLWGDLKVEEVQWLAVDYNIVDSAAKCSLVHAGALLEPSQSLRDYGIESDTTISIFAHKVRELPSR